MAKANEVGLGLAALGIAAGFAAGIFSGRTAAELVEEDIARVTRASAASASLHRSVHTLEPAVGEGHEVVRYKIAVTAGQPSVGPSDALVTIVEWCDLYGESCRNVDALLSAVIERHPLEVRRVFRSLRDAHHGSDLALEVARAAHEADKFWDLRERLSVLDRDPSLVELQAHAEAIGMEWPAVKQAIDRRSYSAEIAADRALAGVLEVRGAARVHVNGRPVEGAITEDKLNAMIDEELARARMMMDDGASREHIYAEIIKPAAYRTQRSSL
jgi:protein-disulfide isomerase